jgi:membrane associated rhomboid family serine protease
MKNFIEILDKFLNPKFVLILFAATACYGFLKGILDVAVFGSALGTVLGYFYGSKQGEAAANLANAQVNAATTMIEKGSPVVADLTKVEKIDE